MKNVAFFGGSGGLGVEVIQYLKTYLDDTIGNRDKPKYTIKSLGSVDVDLQNESEITAYFKHNQNTDVVVIFSNYNYNSFVHKYSTSYDELDKQISINIAGVTKCIVEALNVMRINGHGRIILASSITADRSVMGTAMYASTKAYYENLVKTICLENATKDITANCIQLGYMDGGLMNTLPDTFREKIILDIPCKRLGSTKEIANALDFLINNPYINGTTIKLTGGL